MNLRKIPCLHLSMLPVLLILCILSFAKVLETPVKAAESTAVKFYTCIMIQEGDSLWSIAKKYRTQEYASVQSYIDEVCIINSLKEQVIHSGQYLSIPYYK